MSHDETTDLLRRDGIRARLAHALVDDHPLKRLDHLLEALTQLRGERSAAVAQCSLWRLPAKGPWVMQRLRGRYLIQGTGLDPTVLPRLFTTDVGRITSPGMVALREQLAASPANELIDDYATICGAEVWRSLPSYRDVHGPLGLENGFTHYWRIDRQRCLNATLWLHDDPANPDQTVKQRIGPLFRLARPLIERVLLQDPLGLTMADLTDRQTEVLHLVLAGFSEKQIARKLHRSNHTIHSHIQDLYRRFDVQTRAELMALFIDEAALPPTDETIERSRGREIRED